MLTIKNLKAKVETDEGGKEILKGLNLQVTPVKFMRSWDPMVPVRVH
jgi:Fe-S cluster assembly ATPase SufC